MPLLRPFLSLALVVGSGLGLYNVYSDNSDVVRTAESIACGASGCAYKKIQESRSPFSQSFVFQTELQPPLTTSVECRRDWLLVGNYHCQ